jgi:hypothetical protein
MPIINAGYILFDSTNDPHGDARAYVARKITQGIRQPHIVRDAWQHRQDLVPNAITSTAFNRPPFRPVDIYYDPADVGNALEAEVINALIRAEQRGGSP